MPSSTSVIDRPSPSGLVDVLDTILDKGLVIDAYVRVSVVGIELITIDLRVVVASVDTAGGVVIAGEVTLSLAGVDMVRLSLRALVSSVGALEAGRSDQQPIVDQKVIES